MKCWMTAVRSGVETTVGAKGAVRNMTAAVVAAALSAASCAEAEGTATAGTVDMAVAWDSRYVSEGRDNLDGESLASATVEASLGGLRLGAWYAASPETDYRELNLGMAYTVESDDLETSIAFTHLRFLTDEEDDNEVGIGLVYAGLPVGLAIGLDAYHSFAAEGSFLEASIGGEYAVCDRLTLAPAAALGWNSGYIADGHDGANHFALSMVAAVPLRDGLGLAATVAYTWAVDADPERHPGDGALGDFLHVGIALRGAF